MMKNLFLLLFLLLLGTSVFLFIERQESDQQAPNSITRLATIHTKNILKSEFVELNGKPFQIVEELSYKAFILHFWATWCGPCIDEIPKLIDYAKKNPQIMVLAVSEDKNLNEVTVFLKNQMLPVNFKLIRDEDGSISVAYSVEKIPESYLYNKKGVFLKLISGALDWQKLSL